MIKGELSFALDGSYMGMAFQDTALKKGPLYAAVSLLHKAGCLLIVDKELPSYFPR
jgi:E3 ubiquitin-protein ligase NRDP1